MSRVVPVGTDLANRAIAPLHLLTLVTCSRTQHLKMVTVGIPDYLVGTVGSFSNVDVVEKREREREWYMKMLLSLTDKWPWSYIFTPRPDGRTDMAGERKLRLRISCA